MPSFLIGNLRARGTSSAWKNTGFTLLFCLTSLFCLHSSATPTPANITEQHFESTLAFAQQMPRLHSLLISRKGEILLEEYFNGRSADDLANVKSVSKSIISTLVGLAIAEGHIKSVDENLGQLLPEHPIIKSDPDKAKITVGQLLSMQSGLETTSNRNYGRWVAAESWLDFALEQKLISKPGGRMIYSTGNTHLLSAIISKTSGESTLNFARKQLFAPLGFHLAAWPRDPEGIYFGGNNMELTPRQLLRYGELYINAGKANGKQVVPGAWIEHSLKAKTESTRQRERYYGYGWWLREMAGYETRYAWGYGGQFVVVVPELDLVVVATSDPTPGDDRRRHTRAMYDLLEDRVVAVVAQIKN